MRRLRQGFTLIELLVVIAITAVLFFLLVRPLIESLRLTQRAQLQAAAQDSARKTLEIISRELASAVYVFDNASHPFTATGTPKASDALFTNFLDLDIPTDPNSTDANAGQTVVAHAFNAKLDFVPARHSSGGGLVDPTTGDPISATQNGTGSATLNTTGLQFPLAPGTTIIRYYIGLKDPTRSYRNTAEKLGLKTTNNPNNVDNTYILYRVQFPLYKKTTDANNVVTYSVNSDLLRTNAATGKPELDDPDFFRYVTANDTDWLSPTHAAYDGGTGAETVAQHNTRVDAWEKIAKPVITAPNIDLLVLPRYADGTPIYDTNHVPSNGSTTDPVLPTAAAIPTVKTSINFTPATVTADASPGTSSDYNSLGVPMNAADNGGLPYVPTVYTASSQSWGFPPHITLAPQGILSSTTPYYTTDLGTAAPPTVKGIAVSPGDLMEYYHSGTTDMANPQGTPVYDITQGIVLQSTTIPHNYIPMSVNPDTGTLSFDTPAQPSPNNQNTPQTGYDQYNRYWTATADEINTGNLKACAAPIGTTQYGFNTPGLLDLTNLICNATGSLTEFDGSGGSNTSPLSNLGQAITELQCANAFIVPGSVRVYGPDQTPGPNLGNSILYTQASPSVPLTYNQYRVDYLNSLLTFNVDAGNQLPTVKADNTMPADPVKVTFNYQANLAPVDSTKPISGTNPASPLLVKVDYQTRDLLNINIGVRVYDPTNGQAFIVPVSNQVKVSNSNR